MSDKQPQAASSAAKAGDGKNLSGDRQTVAKPKPDPKPKPAAKPAPRPGAANRGVKPPAQAAYRRRRHGMLMLSFVLIVILPAVSVAAYLVMRAEDQYASTLGFVVRKEETSSAVELLGGLTQLSGSSSSDTDILNEFIQSQQLVLQVDERLGLREMFSRHYETDPVFSLKPGESIEALVSYWSRMVSIYYDPGSGLIELQVKAFAPDEAQAIAEVIFEQSAAMINQLSAIAREDTTRYTREELELSIERLKGAREAVAQFRSRTRIVDPQADLQVRMGVLSNLQQQLAAALIEGDLLIQTTRAGDPRIDQAARRIAVIQDRISQERNKFTIGGEDSVGEEYINVLSEFERLSVDREFAERAYLASLTAFDTAQAEAQRKSLYLAAYVTPTLPEEALYPQRFTIGGLTAVFLLMIWAVGVLIYYSIKDRR